MEKFNLEEALAGKPVVTRNGKKVTELHLFKSTTGKPVIAIVEGLVAGYTILGKDDDARDSIWDLFMAPQKKSIWVNVHHCGNTLALGRGRYPTEAEAREKITNKETYIKTIEIAVE
jgi:hypothetical protein